MIDQKVFVDELQKIETSIRKHSNSMADRVREYIDAINSSNDFVELINNDLINILIQQLKLNDKRSELGIKYIFELLVMKKIKNEQLISLLELYKNIKNYNEKVQLKMLQSIFYIIENDNITNGTFFKLFSIVLTLTNDKKSNAKYKVVIGQLIATLFDKMEKLEHKSNLNEFKDCEEEVAHIDLITDSNTTDTSVDIKKESKNKINDSLVLLYRQECKKVIDLLIMNLNKNKTEKVLGIELLNIVLKYNVVLNDSEILDFLAKQLIKESNASEQAKLSETIKMYLFREIELKIPSHPIFNQIILNLNINSESTLNFILSLENYIFKKDELFESLISMIKTTETTNNDDIKIKIIEFMVDYLTANEDVNNKEKYYIFLSALHKYLKSYEYSSQNNAVINIFNKVINHLSSEILKNNESIETTKKYFDIYLEIYANKFDSEMVENINNIKSILKDSYKILIMQLSSDNWNKIVEYTKEYNIQELEDIIQALVNFKTENKEIEINNKISATIENIFYNNIKRICENNNLLKLILTEEEINYNIMVEIINNIEINKEREEIINNYLENKDKTEDIFKIIKLLIKRHKDNITEYKLIFNVIEQMLNSNTTEDIERVINKEINRQREYLLNVEEKEKIYLIFEIVELLVEHNLYKNLDSYYITKLYIFIYSIISYSLDLNICLSSISLFDEIRINIENMNKIKDIKDIESYDYLKPISNKILSALLNHKYIEVVESVIHIIFKVNNLDENVLDSVIDLLIKLNTDDDAIDGDVEVDDMGNDVGNNAINNVIDGNNNIDDNKVDNNNMNDNITNLTNPINITTNTHNTNNNNRDRKEKSFIFITNLLNDYLLENNINYNIFISKYFNMLEDIIIKDKHTKFKNIIISSTSSFYKRYTSNREILLISYNRILKNLNTIEYNNKNINTEEYISNIIEILEIFNNLNLNEKEIRKYFIDNNFYYLDKYILLFNDRITLLLYDILEYVFSSNIKLEVINFYIFIIENYNCNQILSKFNTMPLDNKLKNKLLKEICRLIENNKINIVEGLEIICSMDITDDNRLSDNVSACDNSNMIISDNSSNMLISDNSSNMITGDSSNETINGRLKCTNDSKCSNVITDDNSKYSNKITNEYSNKRNNNKSYKEINNTYHIEYKENIYYTYLNIFNRILNLKNKEYDIDFYNNYYNKNLSVIEDINFKIEEINILTVKNTIDRITKNKIKFLLQYKNIMEKINNNNDMIDMIDMGDMVDTVDTVDTGDMIDSSKVDNNNNSTNLTNPNNNITNLTNPTNLINPTNNTTTLTNPTNNNNITNNITKEIIESYKTLINLTYSSTKLSSYAYNLLFYFKCKNITIRNLFIKRIKEVLKAYATEIIIYKELYCRRKKEEVSMILKNIKNDIEIIKEVKYEIIKCVRSKDKEVVEDIEEIIELLFKSYE